MREAAVSAAFGPPRIAGALLLTLLLVLSCSFRCDAQGVLPPREVDALRQIAAKLNIPTTLWNFSLNPCDSIGDWGTTIICDCNASTKVCQVVEILLSGRNLAGELPKEFGNLTSLTRIGLAGNYISGSIPAADWASLPLRNITLYANSLSGPIPDAIGNISTLQYLLLDNNMLQGSLPPSLWNLTNLSKLHLHANNFTGELPQTLGNLKKLSSLYLGDNRLSGPIPDAIGKISALQILYLAGNRLSGPIPDAIGNISTLQYLYCQGNRLSGPIPDAIGKISTLQYLFLGINQLSGPIPDAIGKISMLQDLLLDSNMLQGSLPPSLGNLTNLSRVNLGRNRLSGPIPDAIGKISMLQELWLDNNMLQGSLPPSLGNLTNLSKLHLSANYFTGDLPETLGNLKNLSELLLDNNMLHGSLPPSLGNLTNLSSLLLSANYFTSELPETLGNLKNLSDFRIDGNDISGKIPSFIGNWAMLQRFDMQGTSLEGPFPAIFSTLQSITELRVSDLKNTDGSFPPLQDMLNLTYLILRNCSISGEIPPYIGGMDRLKTLDLSFNNLTGAIPYNFEYRRGMENIYLTSNALSGAIPSWILKSKQNWDISYNNFTVSTSEPAPKNCPQGDQNIIASFSSTQNDSVPNCLRKDLPCSQNATNDNFFINCGGARVTVNNVEYEDDTSLQGTSTYYHSENGNWAYSSTGDFMDNNSATYIAQNTSMLTMPNPELYMTARLNPLSLKYFGLCMQKGNYTVQLHFAEIMFTDDQTFHSKGRRVFDVSIQGIKVLKDFNIAQAANGTGKEIIKKFTTYVEGSTLEIHFRWAGKGTNAIPNRGVYGSLISAISVTPNFKPDLGEKKKLPVGAIVGIVAASCALVILVSIFLWFLLRRRDVENSELKGLELQTGYFTLRQIKAATKNFDPAYKIGEGGFGPVYKGVLPDGSAIAVKQLSSKSKQGNREFVNEIGMISALQHPHLVKLFGCCIEENQLLLIYEYMENNCLARALFGPEDVKLKLDWKTRHRICLGIARGLAYLHEESRLKIVHRDIKATNILLDKDLNAKISDFGLAKLDEEDNTHISTRVAGTWGYMAPEYATRGYLTDKADVYSFGVVILEIVSGKNNTNFRPKEDLVNLLDWAHVLQEQGSLLELVDPSLGTDYSKEEAQQMLNLALLCTSPTPTVRPPMSMVVSMLEGKVPVTVPPMEHIRQANHEMPLPSFEIVSYDSQKRVSMDTPGVDSSTSMQSSKGDVAFHSATSKLRYTEEH